MSNFDYLLLLNSYA
jgi:factor associated with neutral sphingomyelinase activation